MDAPSVNRKFTQVGEEDRLSMIPGGFTGWVADNSNGFGFYGFKTTQVGRVVGLGEGLIV